MDIYLPDGSKHSLPENSKAYDLADLLNLKGPDKALAVSINDKTVDLCHPLQDGDKVRFWDFADKEGQEIFWHTSAHVLAQAVLRLWPEAKPTIGPAIADGFYYDFANLTISDSDFVAIEKMMKEIIKENHRPEKFVFANKKEALEAFQGNVFKEELINDLEEDVEFTAYRQGDFFDLCRGPHLPSMGKIKALKVMRTSGAYWRGDSSRPMLTRIYAITFPDRKLLKEHLVRLEEARKRDHKVLGPKLDLFSMKEEAPGMPFIHPKGMALWNSLIDFWRSLHQSAGYLEIKTPSMMTRNLWEISGHWKNYRENMFCSIIEDRDFAIKPMNCPGACLYFKGHAFSYRDLPMRVAELGLCHRYEPSGALSGLFRVRSFHMDDAHIYMKPSDIEGEILKVLELTERLYSTFGLEYHLELSTRPEKNTIGTDEDWQLATQGLEEALIKSGRQYVVNPGDGAFYGPKIDMHIKDALGRTWQCGTVQLDMSLPEKFDLSYTDQDGTKKRPVMIHRAIFGSLERFMGILIEHFAGKLPLWLNPRQVRLLTVADRHEEYAQEVHQALLAANLRSEVDDSNESVSKKVRNAQIQQVNYILTIGDKELENKTINLRTRDNVIHGEMLLEPFIENLCRERDHYSLSSPFQSEQTAKA